MKLNFLINKNSLFFKNNDELKEKYYKLSKMKNVYIGNNCSELLYKLIFQIKQKNNTINNIYLPAYFCGQSLRFLRKLNIKINFYKLTDELLPDYQLLKKLSLKNKVDLFILVHYFGRIKGQKEANEYVNK